MEEELLDYEEDDVGEQQEQELDYEDPTDESLPDVMVVTDASASNAMVSDTSRNYHLHCATQQRTLTFTVPLAKAAPDSSNATHSKALADCTFFLAAGCAKVPHANARGKMRQALTSVAAGRCVPLSALDGGQISAIHPMSLLG